MLLLLASLALGASLQEVGELEWRRAPAEEIAALATDPELRAEVAVALGRLRSPDALPHLVALGDDADPAVRLAVADALGFTPGAAPQVRAWLDRLPPPGRPPLPPSAGGERAALLRALGRLADPADVPRLVEALALPFPFAEAAAKALGQMARAEKEAVAVAIPALVAATARVDPRTVEAAAFALARAGVTDPALAGAVAERAPQAPTPAARAWMIKAAWPGLEAEAREALFDAGLADPTSLVRAAAVQAVRQGDLPLGRVAPLLGDPDPWVRLAAVEAVGRLGGENAAKVLSTGMEGWSPWWSAAALEAMAEAGTPPAAALAEARHPAPIRAAAVAGLEGAALERLALEDPEPAVRTAAVGVLLEREAGRDVALRLLDADDEAVREGAVELLGEGELDPAATEALAARALVEADPAVRGVIARRLGRSPEASAATASIDDALGVASARVTTSRGEFRIDLLPEVAPLAVASFAKLADANFFDGLVFHRVVPGFVVQGGDPRGDGWGGPGFTIPDEVSGLPYDTGAVGMARADRDTGGSQWFVTTSPQPHLEGDYTLFGRVTYGMHVVRALERGDAILDVVIERP